MIIEFKITVRDDDMTIKLDPPTLRIQDDEEVLRVLPIGHMFQEKWNVLLRQAGVHEGPAMLSEKK